MKSICNFTKVFFLIQTCTLTFFLSSCENGLWDIKRSNPNDSQYSGERNTNSKIKNDQLPTLTTLNTTNVTTTSAFSGGNISSDGGSVIIARGVCWEKSPSPTVNNSKTTDGSGTGVFSSSLSGLSTNTLYYVRSYATNINGTSYGNEISFSTSIASTTFNNELNKIQFLNNSFGYSCGNGIILKTNNGGSQWVSVKESLTIDFTSIYFTSTDIGYVGGNDRYYAYVYKTTNGGLSWQEVGKFWFQYETLKITGIFSSLDGNKIIALLNQYPNASQVYGRMFFSNNSGSDWTSAQGYQRSGFDCGDMYNQKIYAGGHRYWNGSTYETSVFDNSFISNGSTSINRNSVDNAVNLNAIDMVSNYGFAVSDNGKFLITTDQGKNWVSKTIPGFSTSSFTSIKFRDNSTGWISTLNGAVLQTSDSGFTWTTILNDNKKINDISIRPDGKLFIAGELGLIKSVN